MQQRPPHLLDYGRTLPTSSELLTSWRRSSLYGLTPDKIDLRQEAVDTDSKFLRQVMPMMTELAERLTDSDTSLAVSDPQGRLLWRWAETTRHLTLLDDRSVIPGFDFSEERIGTNGVGTALEVNHAVVVKGEEHFANVMLDFACFGAPVHHPLTRRILGIINITSRAELASPLLYAVLSQFVAEIERRLLDILSTQENELLSSFIKEKGRSRKAVASLNENMIIANQAATRMGIDRDLLWDVVLKNGNRPGNEFPVPGLEGVFARARSLSGGPLSAGAVVVFRDAREGNHRTTATPDTHTDTPVTADDETPVSVIDRVDAAVGRALHADRRLIVSGEQGCGKWTTLSLVLAKRDMKTKVSDALLISLDGFNSWMDGVRENLQSNADALVIRHLERLDTEQQQIMQSILDDIHGDLVVAATWRMPAADPAQRPTLSARPTMSITVPPLRNRGHELADITREVIETLPGSPEARFTAAALDVMRAHAWPRNMSEFTDAVAKSVEMAPDGIVTPVHLPSDVRLGNHNRKLSPLEEAETRVIVEVLARCDGNKTLAADMLHISRTSLYQRMDRFHIY